MMKHLLYTACIIALMLCTACNKKEKKATLSLPKIYTQKGDSTIYGLACDGCTDSILVLLPQDCTDPDTFFIFDALRNHKAFGRPKIGDKMAITVDRYNKKTATWVLDIQRLEGTWCYMVEPKWKALEIFSKKTQKKIQQESPDSVKASFMIPREYALIFKSQFNMGTSGHPTHAQTSDETSPVEYPPLKYYTEWHVYNGHLVLTEDLTGIPGFESIAPTHDTVDVIMMRSDSLILQFKDHTQNFYRQKEEVKNVNKKK